MNRLRILIRRWLGSDPEGLFDDAPFMGPVTCLMVGADDIFVVTFSRQVSTNEADHLKSVWSNFWQRAGKPCPPILMLDAGAKLSLVTKSAT